MLKIKSLLIVTVTLLLSGCSVKEETIMGFMSLDGQGISEHPFDTDADITVGWKDGTPEFVALPIYVSGDVSDTHISDATYEVYSTTETNPYCHVIEEGYQEGIEDLFTEIYGKLNGEIEMSYIDGDILNKALSDIHGDSEYGTLQDTLTDMLMLVKNINEQGVTEEFNTEAVTLYNNFYQWLYSWTADKF